MLEVQLTGRTTTEQCIEEILSLRRARTSSFGSDLFSDVCWDILLELFSAKLAGRSVKLSELAMTSPKSTVARWAAVLQDRELISGHIDYRGTADVTIALSEKGLAKMTEIFRHFSYLQHNR